MLPEPPAPFVLLDNARLGGTAAARLFSAPVEVVSARKLSEVQPALDRLAEAAEDGLHAAGYLGYEAGFALEPRLAALSAHESDAPLLWFGLFAREVPVRPDEVPGLLPDPARGDVGPIHPLIDRDAYGAAFERVQRYIRDGDIYQANLAFPCAVAISGDPRAVYARLRARARASFGGIVFTGREWLLSFSPEKFFSINDTGQVSARPMKGTAVRAGDGDDRGGRDAAIARALAADPKQRAENLMIVDLIRNDLSRVSAAGSVTVPSLFRVETYPTIHQMVSDVHSRLLPGLGPIDVLRALFPCGSITGAPKLRAMEVIAEVEHAGRGPYTGAIGRIGVRGDAAFNVAIRTICVKDGSNEGRLGLGSGVVADSDVEAEWQECLAKARFLTEGA